MYKWQDKEFQALIVQTVEEGVATIRATLMSQGCDMLYIDSVCSKSRQDMLQTMGNLRKDCLWLGRPVEIVYAEVMLCAHSEIVNACTEANAVEAVDLGFTTTARREFYEVFSSIDTVGMSDYYKSVIADYLTMFLEDWYALDFTSTNLLKENTQRLFDLD